MLQRGIEAGGKPAFPAVLGTRLPALVASILVGAALVPSHASAGVVASCTNMVGTPLTVGEPNALAQTFSLSATRQISSVRTTVSASSASAGTLLVAKTTAGGAPADSEVDGVLASAPLPLTGSAPLDTEVALPGPITLPAGTYAVIVEPPSGGTVSWAQCQSATDGG